MALFRFLWLRNFIRRHTSPIPEGAAEVWKRRLSLGYMLLAWNAFGFVAYMIYTGKADWAKSYGLKSEAELSMTPAQQWTRTLGIKDATVYRIQGLNVKRYEVHNDLDGINKTKNEDTIEERETEENTEVSN